MKIVLACFMIICLAATCLRSAKFSDVSVTNLPLDALKANSMDVVSIDMDKDGDKDLILAMEFRPNVILLNDGAGKFSHANVLPAKNHDSEDIAAEDFDK